MLMVVRLNSCEAGLLRVEDRRRHGQFSRYLVREGGEADLVIPS